MNPFPELPERVSRSLIGAKILTVRDLVFTENLVVLNLPGIGKATLRNIRKVYGASFFDRRCDTQAELLGIPFEEIILPRMDKGWMSPTSGNTVSPEKAVFNFFQSSGWEGSYWEGYPLCLLQDAACQHFIEKDFGEYLHVEMHITRADKVVEINAIPDRYLWLACGKGSPRDLIEPSVSVTDETFRNNLERLIQFRSALGIHDDAELGMDFLMRLRRIIDKDIFRRILELQIDDNGKPRFYTGWPDLTMIKGESLQFVEVKANDRIHKSQLDTFLGIFRELGLNLKIVRVKPAPSDSS